MCEDCSNYSKIPQKDLDECISCCLERVVCLNPDLKYAWTYLVETINQAEKDAECGNDVKFVIVYSYSAIPSLTNLTFRSVMIKFFKKKGINIDLLNKTSWLPKDINLKKELWKGILITQGDPLDLIAQEQLYADAIVFFTQEKERVIHRNKVAHDFPDSLNLAKSVNIIEVKKRMFHILHSMARIITHC